MNVRYLKCIVSFCASIIFNAQVSNAQTESTDTTYFSTTLQEIVVDAPEAIRTGNKDVYYPAEALKKSMSTSSQLLAALQIPDLIVNPATGEIAISGGENLSIRINGRPVSNTDLMTISAKDIIKVEYISNPGIRYGDASAVLEVSVKRKNEGYGIIFNLLQSPNRGWGDYTAGLKYAIGRSEWSADYHSNPMWHMDCYRDNTETFNLGKHGMVERRENGRKTPNRMATHKASMQYSYACRSSVLFNAQVRLQRQDDRYASTGNITTDFNGAVHEGVETEIAPYRSWQVDLDLYLHLKINGRNKLYFNVVPTFLSSDSERIYEADDISIENRVMTNGQSLLAEALWEGRIGSGVLTSGLRGLVRNIKADYLAVDELFRDRSSESHCFVEWNHSFGNFRYIVGLDVSMFNISSPVSKRFFNIVPKLFLRFSPFPFGGLSIALDGNVVDPTIMQLNPIRQQIDRYQYSQGCMDLRPYRTCRGAVEFDFNVRNIQGKLSFADKYAHSPVMGGKMLEEGRILQSYFNSGFHNDFIIKGQIRTPVFIKNFTLSVEGGWHTMVSKGIDYCHRYSQAFINAQLMLMAGKWWFMAKYNNAYNMLWGERISSINNNLLNLGVGYRCKDVTFMAGIVNPIGNVSLKSRDLSLLAGYQRTYHAASTNCLGWLGISLNIYKGKRRTATRKKLDNNTIYETIKNVQK